MARIKERHPVEYYEAFPIKDLSGAEYNPRLLTDEKREKLKKSISELGFLFPVIAHKRKFDNDKYVLLAGHQRMRILKELGADVVPTIIITYPLTLTKEKKINQWHNEIENHFVKPPYTIDFKVPLKVKEIQMIDLKDIDLKYDLSKLPTSFSNINKGKKRSVRINLPFVKRVQKLCDLMASFGNFNTCIVGRNKEGIYRVLFGFEYILACERMGLPVRVSMVEDSKFELAEQCLTDKYGVNDFSSIQSSNTFVQSNAQPPRADGVSRLYRVFFKHINSCDRDRIQGGRFLDIFCGRGKQAEGLKKSKYKKLFSVIDNFELFAVGKKYNLSLSIARYQIQRTYQSIVKGGLYDFVICDSVLNSVDSLQAELDVIRCCFAFTKAGGLFAMSGRLFEDVVQCNGSYTAGHLDAEGFECKEHDGHFFFQRYYRGKNHFLECVNNAIPADSYSIEFFKINVGLYCVFRKKYDILTNEMCDSIKREFDLCHKDISIGYGSKMLSLFKSIYGE